MKKYILFALLLVSQCAFSQVNWKISSEKLGENIYRVTVTGIIEQGFHIYDTEKYPTGGPNSTVLTFIPGAGCELTGPMTTVSEVNRHFDDTFSMEIGTMEGTAVFTQDIKLLSDSATIACNVEWMACDDTSCIPPDDIDLSVTIGESGAVSAPVVNSGRSNTGDGGLWGMILAAILWGLAALLTPCVFPMIPMTVSFFI